MAQQIINSLMYLNMFKVFTPVISDTSENTYIFSEYPASYGL